MFDIGWSELLIIGVVALIVVGPKDLPKMFRTLGQVTGKLRGMAREFTRAMEAAADETGVKDVAKTFRETASGKTLRDAAGFDEIEKEFRDIGRDPLKSGPVSSPASSARGGPKPALGHDSAPKVDSDTAARNASLSETEAERLKRVERAAEARRQAADIRARREAEAQQATTQTPPAPPPAPQG